jgi:hypothetical protein
MADHTNPLFSFGVIADAQYCDCEPAIGRYYRNSTQKLADALQSLHQHELAFILDLGDLIDRDFQSFDDILKVYEQSKFRVYRTLGNHDFSVADAQKSRVANRLGLDQAAYYDFVYLGWRFIILNGNEISTYAHPEGSAEVKAAAEKLAKMERNGAVNARPWNGGISQQQLAWLESKLEAAQQEKQRVIISNHFPVYPEDSHNLWNDREVVNLLTRFPQVVAYFNGHNHAGNYGQKEHVHFLNFTGMVETEGQNTFAAVEVYPDHLKVRGYGREGSRKMFFSV